MKRVVFAILALAPCCAWAQNPLDRLRIDDLSATRTRPLFAATRRPPIPVGIEAPAPPPTVNDAPTVAQAAPFELLGSAIGRETAFALLRNKTTGKVIRLRMGDNEEGWRIDSIARRSVTLERDGRKETLALLATPSVEVTGETTSALPSLADAKRADELLNR